MENEEVVGTSNDKKVEPTATVEPTKATTEAVVEKVFTQAQLDEIVVNRLGKERARMLKKLGIDDEAKIDEIIAKSTQYETVKSENESLKSQKAKSDKIAVLSKLNADPEFTDYLLEKIEVKDNSTFEDSAKTYLETHKKFVKEAYTTVNSSVNIKGEPYPDFTQMTAEQYLSWRAKNKL